MIMDYLFALQENVIRPDMLTSPVFLYVLVMMALQMNRFHKTCEVSFPFCHSACMFHIGVP